MTRNWSTQRLSITKTCPCNGYPHIPHFYIASMGYAGVYQFFIFLLQNIDYGYSLEPPPYSLEPPHGGGSNVYPQSMFWSKNKKNIKFPTKFSIFTAEKNIYILHGQLFVMVCSSSKLEVSQVHVLGITCSTKL